MTATTAPLVVVTGTGTGIGKTHFTAALVATWANALREAGRPAAVAGIKPVESGVPRGADGPDGTTLGRMSTFHVKRFPAPYLLARSVSPHLAARDEGVAIDLDRVVQFVASVRNAADAVALELPGGLFSPLSPTTTNADLVLALSPSATLLVAPDRLGVLHDVAATTRAAAATSVALRGIILVAPEVSDPSTTTNAAELPLVTTVPVLASLGRASVDDLAKSADVRDVVARLEL